MIGFAVLGAAGLSAAVRGRAAVGVALIAIAIAATARLEIEPVFGAPVLPTAEGMRQELDKLATDGSEPIVVANAHAFMELSYYLDPPLRERLVFPLSRDLDLKYRGFDTDALTLGPLSRRAPIRVKAYEEILGENKSSCSPPPNTITFRSISLKPDIVSRPFAMQRCSTKCKRLNE